MSSKIQRSKVNFTKIGKMLIITVGLLDCYPSWLWFQNNCYHNHFPLFTSSSITSQ